MGGLVNPLELKVMILYLRGELLEVQQKSHIPDPRQLYFIIRQLCLNIIYSSKFSDLCELVDHQVLKYGFFHYITGDLHRVDFIH